MECKFMLDRSLAKIKQRDITHFPADLACIQAIAQAAINVELFTIPLYMTALYSVHGMHQITSKNSKLYEKRWWPGSAPTAGAQLSTNADVFNKVYSIFVGEMLHLQLASNMASMLNITPCFTSQALQTTDFGWKCYDNKTEIPHILDFKDWKGASPAYSSRSGSAIPVQLDHQFQ